MKIEDKDVKRVGGDKMACCKHDHVISAAELKHHFLSLPVAPGCSASRLNNAEELMLL